MTDKQQCWKDTFKTVKKARQAAKSAQKKYGMFFSTYKCDKCDFWHLSSHTRKDVVEFKEGKKGKFKGKKDKDPK